MKMNILQLLNQRETNKEPPYFAAINAVLMISLFTGIDLIVWEVDIYRSTFISFIIPFAIWIGTGIIVTPFLKNFLSDYFGTRNVWLQCFYNVATWGSIIIFAFMWTNENYGNTTSFTVPEEIVSTGYISPGRYSRCRQPFVVIDYKGLEKELRFYCGMDVQHYKSVSLVVKTGFFGYDVMVKKELLEQ